MKSRKYKKWDYIKTIKKIILPVSFLIIFASSCSLVSFRLSLLEKTINTRVSLWEQKMGLEQREWIKAKASHFGRGDNLLGRHMYTGVKLNDKDLFFASRDIPMGTKVHFYYEKTGKHAVGICMDWGPAKWTGKIVDLGPALADSLGFKGVDYVAMRVLE